MARVVQRSSPPYLAIVFVFLFIIAAGFAAWFYTEWRDTESQAAAATGTLKNLGSNAEVNDTTVKARANDKGRSVFGQYRQDIRDLVAAIAGKGSDTSTDEVLADVDGVLAGVAKAETAFDVVVGDADGGGQADATPAAAGKHGLLDIVARLSSEYAASAKRAADLQAMLDQASEQMTNALQDAAGTQRTLSDQLRQSREELTALQSKFDELSDSFQSNIQVANTEWDSRTTALQTDVATGRKDILSLQVTVEDLQKELKTVKGTGGRTDPTAELELLADGNVLKVLEAGEHTIVYLDIGSNDRVRMGLTFAVYSKHTGVSAEAKGKGTIVVKSVSPSTAECLVLRSKATDPIVAGDLVANLAFSSTRQPVFVVEGDFDLDANGTVDNQSNDTVKAMIGRFGGHVADEITVDTDYVVMGMEPKPMPQPDADAPPTETALWQDSQNTVQQYRDMVSRAIALNKPILNTDQLLTYIGFAPEILKP